jgi:hypothetical protein
MVFSPVVPSTVPTSLALEVSGGGSSLSEPFDVQLGGYKFMLNAGPESPFIRRGANYRSDQVNFSGDPGELALGFWWQRSQDTWSFGAGNPTFDGPGSGDPDIAIGRFFESEGVDVWTPGEFKLLYDTDLVEDTASSSGNDICTVVFPLTAFTQVVVWSNGTTLRRWSGGAVTSVAGGGSTIVSLCTDGNYVFFTDGSTVKKYDGTTVSTVYTAGGDTIRFAKQRLILCDSQDVYELDPNASSAALPTALFTHPNPSWVWVDVCAGPGAIYAGGYGGASSAVYKFVLDTTTGALPTLSDGIVALELPAGERLASLYAYIGLFVAVGTSEGLRVCQFSDTDIVLAPLTFSNGYPVYGITGWDKYLFCNTEQISGDAFTGLIRVDLSAETAPGTFAWANDATPNSDPAGFTGVYAVPGQVTMRNGLPVAFLSDEGVFAVTDDRYRQSGYLTTGRILFGMSDPKVFQRLGFVGSGEGTVALYTGTDTPDAAIFRTSIDMDVRNKIEVDVGSTKGSTLTLKFELTRGSDTATPVVESYQAKALPAQAREDQYIIPLRCYDRVENRYGQTEWQRALTSVNAVSAMVRSQEPVTLQFFFGDIDEWVTLVVQVEDYEFKQVTCEPDDGWGGLLTVSCRTLLGEQD